MSGKLGSSQGGGGGGIAGAGGSALDVHHLAGMSPHTYLIDDPLQQQLAGLHHTTAGQTHHYYPRYTNHGKQKKQKARTICGDGSWGLPTMFIFDPDPPENPTTHNPPSLFEEVNMDDF